LRPISGPTNGFERRLNVASAFDTLGTCLEDRDGSWALTFTDQGASVRKMID
jgi:hypothetical protein